MDPVRRVLLAAALAARVVAPVVVMSAAVLVTACNGKKKVEKPDKPVKPVVDVKALLAQARDAAATGDVDTAHAKYKEAEKADYQLAIGREHVKFLLANRPPDAAVAIAKGYYVATPADTAGFLVYANALIGAGDLATAIEVATELVDLDEKNPAGYEARGRARILADQVPEGIADLRIAVELAPKNATYLTSLGSGLEQAKQIDEAALKLRAAIELEPENARALRLLGMVRRQQFEVQEAVSWLIKATKADPNDAEAWFQLAVAQNDMGDNIEAESSAQKATAIEPGSSRYWYVYGEMLRINKKPELAIEAYRKAMDQNPPHPKAAGKLAKVLAESGHFAEAEVFLTEAAQLDRNNADLYFNLGYVYGEQKKYRLAIEAYEKYLELASKDDGLRKHAMDEIRALKRAGRIR